MIASLTMSSSPCFDLGVAVHGAGAATAWNLSLPTTITERLPAAWTSDSAGGRRELEAVLVLVERDAVDRGLDARQHRGRGPAVCWRGRSSGPRTSRRRAPRAPRCSACSPRYTASAPQAVDRDERHARRRRRRRRGSGYRDERWGRAEGCVEAVSARAGERRAVPARHPLRSTPREWRPRQALPFRASPSTLLNPSELNIFFRSNVRMSMHSKVDSNPDHLTSLQWLGNEALAQPGARVAEDAHPRAVLAPAVGVPGHLDAAEHALAGAA